MRFLPSSIVSASIQISRIVLTMISSGVIPSAASWLAIFRVLMVAIPTCLRGLFSLVHVFEHLAMW